MCLMKLLLYVLRDMLIFRSVLSTVTCLRDQRFFTVLHWPFLFISTDIQVGWSIFFSTHRMKTRICWLRKHIFLFIINSNWNTAVWLGVITNRWYRIVSKHLYDGIILYLSIYTIVSKRLSRNPCDSKGVVCCLN